MATIITIIHILACIFLVLVVLLQTGKGADMGAVFGGSSSTVFGSSGAGNFLTRLTAAMAAVFMVTSLTLTYMSARRLTSTVVDSTPLQAPPPLEQPANLPAPAAQPQPAAPVQAPVAAAPPVKVPQQESAAAPANPVVPAPAQPAVKVPAQPAAPAPAPAPVEAQPQVPVPSK
jgi:preprotein translocase subunit SecG